MKLYKYILTIKHDAGKIKIATVAQSAKIAANTIRQFENCPSNAIVKVQRVARII